MAARRIHQRPISDADRRKVASVTSGLHAYRSLWRAAALLFDPTEGFRRFGCKACECGELKHPHNCGLPTSNLEEAIFGHSVSGPFSEGLVYTDFRLWYRAEWLRVLRQRNFGQGVKLLKIGLYRIVWIINRKRGGIAA